MLVELPMQEIEQRFGVSAVAVHRAELQAALAQALEPGTLRTNMQGIAFEQDEEVVRVRFASGETMRGDVLVGADGLYSAVRSQLVGAAKPHYVGYVAWRGVTPLA